MDRTWVWLSGSTQPSGSGCPCAQDLHVDQRSDDSSAYDDDTKDPMNQGLYTRGWTFIPDHRTSEQNIMTTHCALWVLDTEDGPDSAEIIRRHVKLMNFGELANAEFMPLYQHIEEGLDAYFRSNTQTEVKGATVMNVCNTTTKTPFVRVAECVIAECNPKASETYRVPLAEHLPWSDGGLVLLLPLHHLDAIHLLMKHQQLVPVERELDDRNLSAARLRLSKSIGSKVPYDLRWEEPGPFLLDMETGADYAAIKRYVSLSVHLRPDPEARGKHTNKREVTIWVHDMET
ncbi:hypothetical protein LTR56_026426 [Elasticomyces elasticus]|nr:hypothetical protein LTR56_026426 [Elasticomyces elasticus]KAK4893664.1 hypothetical protein LTR49_028471 [Elasticomyces elasticus]